MKPILSFRDLDSKWQHIGAMLRRMIDKADTFCIPPKPPESQKKD